MNLSKLSRISDFGGNTALPPSAPLFAAQNGTAISSAGDFTTLADGFLFAALKLEPSLPTVESMQSQSKFSIQQPPILAGTLHDLRVLLKRPNTTNADLQRVLLRDTGAAIALFRELHRVRPQATEEVTDIAHALSLLGNRAVEGLIRNAAVIDPTLVDDPWNSILYQYSQAAHGAYYAAALARINKLSSPSQLACTTLTLSPAVTTLWLLDPHSAVRATNAMRDGVRYETAFHGELGGPVPAINHWLAGKWGLPPLVQETLAQEESTNSRQLLVNLASVLAKATAANWHTDELNTLLELLQDFLPGIRMSSKAWLMSQAAEAARDLEHLGLPLPAFRGLYLPGDEQEVQVPDFTTERQKKAAATVKPAQPGAAPHQPADLNRLLANAMKLLHQQAGLGRVLFAMPNAEGTLLRTRLVAGAASDDPLRKSSAPLNTRNLFGQLLLKPQALWFNADNRTRYQPFIPAEIRPHLGDEFFISSVFVNGKPLGLMYGDNPDHPLGEQDYKLFRQLCRQFEKAALQAPKASLKHAV